MTNARKVERLFQAELRRSRVSHSEARRRYEELWRYAKRLGVFPLRDPLAGIESDLRLARALNPKLSLRVRKTPR